MNTLIFIAVLAGCVGYVFYAFKQADTKSLDISYTHTSALKDAIDILDNMHTTDPNYRHFAEIKVTAHGDRPLSAPYSNQNVIYYTNQCFAVTQEKKVTYDSQNRRHETTVKKETALSCDTSSEPILIKDNSITSSIYLDLQSFAGEMDLTPGCDRFEPKTSQFARTMHSHYTGGSNFLGFRLKEEILREGQPLYVLGELYRMGNALYFGSAHQSNKTSMVSVKSEDQILTDVKKSKTSALVKAAGIAVLAAIILL